MSFEEVITLARNNSTDGDVALRLRPHADPAAAARASTAQPDTGVHELIVNGAFAMDSTETASERALADATVDELLAPADCRVLVGGLGLGYTATQLLDRGVGFTEVVEREPALVEWADEAITEQLGRLAADPQVDLQVGDIAAVLAGSGERHTDSPAVSRGEPDPHTEPAPVPVWDAVLLDVDNGPDFLVHEDNRTIYHTDSLARAVSVLQPGGILAIWCQHASPELLESLRTLEGGPVDSVRELLVPVEREGHQIEYAIYLAKAS